MASYHKIGIIFSTIKTIVIYVISKTQMTNSFEESDKAKTLSRITAFEEKVALPLNQIVRFEPCHLLACRYFTC